MGIFMLQQILKFCKLNLQKVYGPYYEKEGLAFMYTDARNDII